MKKGLSITLIIVGLLIFVALLLNLYQGGIWILEGLNGKDGQNGADGKDGQNGSNGKSAYELAVEDGFDGSLHEWLLSLAVRGSDGKDGKPGASGTKGDPGVSVRDVKINAEGHLLVTLTDGKVLDAGLVSSGSNTGSTGGTGGSLSPVPDADGYYETYEMVVMNATASSLYLRDVPGTGKVVHTAVTGEELLRIGDQQTPDGYSRLVYNGEICYAKSKYFDLKYIYEGEMPSVNLPCSVVLTEGKQFWFITDQILQDNNGKFTVSYSYSGKGERVYDGQSGFALTPAWKNTSATTPHPAETETLTVSIGAYEDGVYKPVTEQTVEVTVVAAVNNLSLCGLVIGDSRISDGTIVTTLQNDMQNLTLLGTRTTSYDVHHEGRGAWSTNHYLNYAETTFTGSTVKNAFYNPATETFDFSYYMEQNYPAASLDFVVINLGANDSFSKASVENLKTMVASIQAYGTAKGKQIAIMVLTEYLSPSDGYYLTQSNNLNVEKMRDKQFAYFTYLADAFEGRESEGIYLLPNYLCINNWSDRLTGSVTTENGTEEKIVDVIHLGLRGYKKEAALIESYLFWIFS